MFAKILYGTLRHNPEMVILYVIIVNDSSLQRNMINILEDIYLSLYLSAKSAVLL